MDYKNICQWFSDNAAQYSDKIAIDYGRTYINYQTLARDSNKLANFFIEHQIPVGAIMLILAESPVIVINSIIAALKMGAVFMPLDPSTPPNRLQTILKQVPPDLCVVERKFKSKLAEIIPSREETTFIFCPDSSSPVETKNLSWTYLTGYQSYSNNTPPDASRQRGADDMSYIYFTSGSTGTPKGIMGQRKGIDHFIDWEINALKLGAGTRVSQLTSPAFDAYLRDIFVPLCAGGTICVPEDVETIFDTRRLVDWLDIKQINLIHCVPSLLRAILNETLNAKQFQALKHILLAGEALLPADINRWHTVYQNRVQIVNLYGPSETTMVKFAYFVQPDDKDRRFIPIGTPILGAKAVLVDEKTQICPPGKIGEIYIRTPYRSLGYYNQPALTEAVFIPNPFTDNPDDIVYKTGDFGRLLPDGNFEFLGRRDHQVKVRGVRIELGEIENLLRTHQGVNDVVVVDREDANGTKYLCAYLVLKDATALEKIKTHLSSQLPDYMLPSAYVTLESLPRTITRKVDRKALPAPGEATENFVAPSTPTQQKLADIFTEILGLDKVSVQSSFFELGGHSLLTLQVIARIQQTFQIDFPLEDFFDAPSVAKLAAKIEPQLQERSQTLDKTAELLAQVKNMSDSEIDSLLNE